MTSNNAMLRHSYIGMRALWLGSFLASILLGPATLIHAQTSPSNPACHTVDKILQTVSILRDIQTNPSVRDYNKNLATLERLSAEIFLPALIPSQNNISEAQALTHPSGSDAVGNYVSNLRATLIIARTESRQDAQALFTNNLTQNFSNGLQSVQRYWSCTSGENALQTGNLDGSDDYVGVSSAVIEYEQSDSPRPNFNASDSQGLSANSRVLNHSKVGRDVSFELSPPYILIGGFILGILGLFFAQNRSKRFKARAKRRILNVPIRVRIEHTDVAMTLVDISRNGVKVRHGEHLGGHKKVNLHINGKWLSGHVIWRNDAFAGVQFRHPMKVSMFNAFVESTLKAKGALA